MLTRRQFLVTTAAALPLTVAQRTRTRDGHLNVSVKPPRQKIEHGDHQLGLGGDRDGLLIVPMNYRPDTPAPLAVMLHGAGGHAQRVASLFSVADGLGVIVLAPESRGPTWDAIRGGFGIDVEFIEKALEYTFDRCAVDRRRIAVGGFSDGATYGLSIGLGSGDLFSHVIACSPGFVIPTSTRGRPAIFISHGTADRILSIDSTSRRIVPELQGAGYNVKYREFAGPHTVPPDIAREAFTWFLGR